MSEDFNAESDKPKTVWILYEGHYDEKSIRGVFSSSEILKMVLGPFFENPICFSWEEVPVDLISRTIRESSCLVMNFLSGEVISYHLGEEYWDSDSFRLVVNRDRVEVTFKFPFYNLDMAKGKALEIRKRMLSEDIMEPGLYNVKTLKRL